MSPSSVAPRQQRSRRGRRHNGACPRWAMLLAQQTALSGGEHRPAGTSPAVAGMGAAHGLARSIAPLGQAASGGGNLPASRDSLHASFKGFAVRPRLPFQIGPVDPFPLTFRGLTATAKTVPARRACYPPRWTGLRSRPFPTYWVIVRVVVGWLSFALFLVLRFAFFLGLVRTIAALARGGCEIPLILRRRRRQPREFIGGGD